MNSRTAQLVGIHEKRVHETNLNFEEVVKARTEAETKVERLKREFDASVDTIYKMKADFASQLQERELLLQEARSLRLRSDSDRHTAELQLKKLQEERSEYQLDIERGLETIRFEISAEKRKNQVANRDLQESRSIQDQLLASLNDCQRKLQSSAREAATLKKELAERDIEWSEKFASIEKSTMVTSSQVDLMHTKRIEDLQTCMERELHNKRELQIYISKLETAHRNNQSRHESEGSMLREEIKVLEGTLRSMKARLEEYAQNEIQLAHAALQATEIAENLQQDYNVMSAIVVERYAN